MLPLPPSIARPLLLFGRPIMSKLVRVDILSSDIDTETDIKHPAGKPFIMLAFVNIAGNGRFLTADDGALLKSALIFLCNNLHDRSRYRRDCSARLGV